MEVTKKDAFALIVRLRRFTRAACKARDEIRSRREDARLRAKYLKRQPNFVYSAELYELEQVEFERGIGQELVRHKLTEFGRILKNIAPVIDAVLTFDEICDVLNVNSADRRGIEENRDFFSLIFLHAVENSAATRSQDYKDTPLFNAAHMLMMEFLCSPEGQAAGDKAMFDVFGIDMRDMRKPGPNDDEGWRDAGPSMPKSPLILH